MKKLPAAGCLLLFSATAFAQAHPVSLDSCYARAKQNYPLIKKYALVSRSREYNLANAAKGYLPQVDINGQATYQSDVTQLPEGVPGIPLLSKDHYKIYAGIEQIIYDGGIIAQQKKVQEATAAIEEQDVAVQLYQLKERVTRLFFGILLIDEQLKQNRLMKEDIRLGLEKTNAAVAHGAALQSAADLLKAALLKAGQQTVALTAGRKAYSDMLGLFIHQPLNEHTVFKRPPDIFPSQEITRPELKLFTYRAKLLDAREALLEAGNRPRLRFFGQAGYGRPAFNILSNDFEPFYIAGLQLSVPLSGFYTLKNKKALIDISRENLAVGKETFLFNTRLASQQQYAGIYKLREMLKMDGEIILLRTNIRKTSLAQLENGVIDTHDYLKDVHAEDGARRQQILHKIQLLQAEYRLEINMGN